MPPRKTRASKKKAEKEIVEPEVEQIDDGVVEDQPTATAPVREEQQVEKPSKGKGKASSVAEETGPEEETHGGEDVSAMANENTKGGKLSQEERLAKLKELRMRMVCLSLALQWAVEN